MKLLLKAFPAGHLVISLLFIGCALALIGFAGWQLWEGVSPFHRMEVAARMQAVLEGIALLTVAVAALELGQTIIDQG